MLKTSLSAARSRLNGWIDAGRASRQRRALRDLPDFVLRDIGLTRGDLQRGPHGW